jgi:ribosome modulation factor
MSIELKDIYWAAGFLEGEGSFTKNGKASIAVHAPQKNIEPLMRLKRIFGGKIIPFKNQWGNIIYDWYTQSKLAASIAMTLYILMSEKRRDQIKRALLAWYKTGLAWGDRTHCPHGHEYNQKNTYVHPKTGHRICRTCNAAWQRIHKKYYQEYGKNYRKEKNSACRTIA